MQGKYSNLDAGVVSYGPCQTPTLNFCVERAQLIAKFTPEPYWVVRDSAIPITCPAGFRPWDRIPFWVFSPRD